MGLALLPLLAACGTATYATLDSNPPGASILVQGRDTGLRTPASLDLENYAADPDEPMPVELRLDGFVPTLTTPYPPRHRCDRTACEHARRTTVSRTLPLFREGTGVRIDALREGYEVAVDDGPWHAVDQAGLAPGATAGITVMTKPGRHLLRWRRRAPEERPLRPGSEIEIEVPGRGFVAVVLHRWPWGIPGQHRAAAVERVEKHPCTRRLSSQVAEQDAPAARPGPSYPEPRSR